MWTLPFLYIQIPLIYTEKEWPHSHYRDNPICKGLPLFYSTKYNLRTTFREKWRSYNQLSSTSTKRDPYESMTSWHVKYKWMSLFDRRKRTTLQVLVTHSSTPTLILYELSGTVWICGGSHVTLGCMGLLMVVSMLSILKALVLYFLRSCYYPIINNNVPWIL